MPTPVTILLVEDHPVVCEGLRRILQTQTEWSVIGEARNAVDAVKLFREHRPTVCLVDLSLQNSSGLELIKQLLAIDEEAKALVLSMHSESIYAERALRAGARGFLRKDVTPTDLISGVEDVLRGELVLTKDLQQQLLRRMVGDSLSENPIHQLSDRELQVFEMLGRGRTTREIAASLHLSPKTIETYRENIKQKLDLKNASELTHRASQWVIENQ